MKIICDKIKLYTDILIIVFNVPRIYYKYIISTSVRFCNLLFVFKLIAKHRIKNCEKRKFGKLKRKESRDTGNVLK